MTPTAEQKAIILAGRTEDGSSLMVEAFAGCAKSTTMKMMLEEMRVGGSLALAFNVKNKKDMEGMLPSWVTVKTFNGLGHSAWMGSVQGRVEVDDRKVGRLVGDVLKGYGKVGEEDWDLVRRLVGRAQQVGLVPGEFGVRGLVEDNPGGWGEVVEGSEGLEEVQGWHFDAARKALSADIREGFNGKISFDDQIYLPLFFGGRWKRYPRVLVDEAQDTARLNHLQVGRSLAADGRLFVFGDSLQGIYAFRGAMDGAMEGLRGLREKWVNLPLTLTFRCPKEAVRRQQEHAVGFRAGEENGEGKVEVWMGEDGWEWGNVEELAGRGSIAVLCRNNAPLLSIAFKLVRRGVGVVMLGREIGKGLVALSKKLLPEDSVGVEECRAVVRKWIEEESAVLLAKGQEQKAEGVVDRGECLLAVLEGGAKDAGEMRRRLTALFSKESGRVTLSSIHKAKGLEWDLVVHLDPWRIPSRQARKAGGRQMKQEMNLRYVAETRWKKVLVLGNVEGLLG